MTRYTLVLLLLCLSGCMRPQDVRQLMGFTEPGVKIVKKKDGQWDFITSSDFKGRGKVDVHADGSYTFDIKMTSDASDVTLAQGERAAIADLVTIRQNENERIIRTQEQLFGLVNSVIQAAIPLLARPPEPDKPPPPIVLPIPGP